MKRAMISAAGCIALLTAVAFLSYIQYDTHYLTSTLKRTLTAAMDPSASENDILAYLRDARLQVRTKKDAEVLKKFQDAVDNTRSCQETRNRQWQETLQSMREMGSKNTPADRLSEVAENYRRNGLAVPKQLYEQIQAAYKNQIEEIKSKQELDKLDSKIADQEEAFAKQLIGEVRAELGLPPLE